jgi:hypothetical protein
VNPLVFALESHARHHSSACALLAYAWADGTILLGINDTNKAGGCADNEGSWKVTIEYKTARLDAKHHATC